MVNSSRDSPKPRFSTNLGIIGIIGIIGILLLQTGAAVTMGAVGIVGLSVGAAVASEYILLGLPLVIGPGSVMTTHRLLPIQSSH